MGVGVLIGMAMWNRKRWDVSWLRCSRFLFDSSFSVLVISFLMLSEDSAFSHFHCLVCGVWFRPRSFAIFVFMLQPIWSKQLTTGTILEANLEEFHGIFSCRFIFPWISEKDSGSVLRMLALRGQKKQKAKDFMPSTWCFLTESFQFFACYQPQLKACRSPLWWSQHVARRGFSQE